MNSVQSSVGPAKSPAFYRFGGWVARHRWPVLIGYLVVFVIVVVRLHNLLFIRTLCT